MIALVVSRLFGCKSTYLLLQLYSPRDVHSAVPPVTKRHMLNRFIRSLGDFSGMMVDAGLRYIFSSDQGVEVDQ